MKYPISWLSEYVDIDLSAQDLADKLSLSGFEVEEIIPVGEKLEGIITGKINKIKPHPDAHKLVITEISDGKTTHQIVTGASNINEGDIVPVSLPGAVLANGMKLKAAKLRGIDSYGMLCSEAELGVADEAAGIWILPPDTPVGVDFIKHATLKDTLLDISILPNRGDTQSMIGLAREISVILDKPLKLPPNEISPTLTAKAIPIQSDADDSCPLYTGRIIKGLDAGKTPLWMQRRLQLAGIRPISLLVDITNYVLLEYGQPLHAFDLTTLSGPKITVRHAKKGEKFTTLDDQTRHLVDTDLLICDAEHPVALAGIMGGQNTEVSDTTTEILLESAYFHPTTVRRTANRLALRTESAVRFEKTVDPNGVEAASDRAAYLYHELAGGQVGPICKAKATDQPLFSSKSIAFDAKQINTLLGAQISTPKMVQILEKLGFAFDGQKQTITIPSWRQHDISEFPCLAEEVARIYGYDDIQTTLPASAVPMDPQSALQRLIGEVESYFKHQGYSQTNTFPLISPNDISALDLKGDLLQLQNPLTIEESVMRPTLLPSLLKVAGFNHKRQVEALQIFEIGKQFDTQSGQTHESWNLQTLSYGPPTQMAFRAEDQAIGGADIYRLKGQVDAIFQLLGHSKFSLTPGKHPHFHPNLNLDICIGKTVVGTVGNVHPKIAKAYDLDLPVGAISINMTVVANLPHSRQSYTAIPKFPHTRRDISLIAPKALSYGEIEAKINAIKPNKVIRFFLFDSFESDKIGADNKSLAIGFIYQHPDRTLSDDEVTKAHDGFCKRLTDALPITIR